MPPAVLQPKPQTFCVNAVKACLQPGLADLFEPLGVVGPAAHPINFCGITGWSLLGRANQSRLTDAGITGRRSYPKPDKASTASTLLDRGQISYDDVRVRDSFRFLAD